MADTENGNRLITQRIRRPDSYNDDTIEKWLEIFYATLEEGKIDPTIHLHGKLADKNSVSIDNIEGYVNDKINKDSLFSNFIDIVQADLEDNIKPDEDPFNKDPNNADKQATYWTLKVKPKNL